MMTIKNRPCVAGFFVVPKVFFHAETIPISFS